MSVFTGKPVTLQRTPAEVSDKFADLTVLKAEMDKLPADQKEKIGDVDFTTDSIIINTPQAGKVSLRVKERTPQRVSMEAVGSPIPMFINVDLKALDGGSATEVTTAVELEIPAMLKPLLKPTMQKAADQFGQLMATLGR